VSLLIAEALLVAVASIVVGGVVGTAMALVFVQILRPLFTIPPAGVTVPALSVAVLLGLVLVVAVAASLVAGAVLRRTRLVEVLREE
jgi:ABC-type antimicrobial peptide transport system permease subunit